jgi:hypothetical protein
VAALSAIGRQSRDAYNSGASRPASIAMPFPRLGQVALISMLAAHAAARMPEASTAPVSETLPRTAETAAEAAAPELIEFTLGPHRFALPSNYFADEQGPDFQGGVTLALLWPELKPYPPGNGYWKQTSGAMRHHRVLVSFSEVGVPIDSLPERHVTLGPDENPNDPSTNIAMRIRRPDRFGLEYYIVDLEKLTRYLAKVGGRPPKPAAFYIGNTSDWFIGHDTQGRVRTVVRCDDGREPEGFEIRDEVLVELPESEQWPLCDGHLFALPDYSVEATASYHRPILRDWQRIERAVREIMKTAYRGPMQEADVARP